MDKNSNRGIASIILLVTGLLLVIIYNAGLDLDKYIYQPSLHFL